MVVVMGNTNRHVCCRWDMNLQSCEFITAPKFNCIFHLMTTSLLLELSFSTLRMAFVFCFFAVRCYVACRCSIMSCITLPGFCNILNCRIYSKARQVFSPKFGASVCEVILNCHMKRQTRQQQSGWL